jgi:hypothetical protein
MSFRSLLSSGLINMHRTSRGSRSVRAPAAIFEACMPEQTSCHAATLLPSSACVLHVFLMIQFRCCVARAESVVDRQVPDLIAFPVECYCVLTCCQWHFVITADGLRNVCGLEDVHRAPFLAPLYSSRGFWSASNSNQSINQSIHTGQHAIAGCLYLSGRLARSPHIPLHVHVFIPSSI